MSLLSLTGLNVDKTHSIIKHIFKYSLTLQAHLTHNSTEFCESYYSLSESKHFITQKHAKKINNVNEPISVI